MVMCSTVVDSAMCSHRENAAQSGSKLDTPLAVKRGLSSDNRLLLGRLDAQPSSLRVSAWRRHSFGASVAQLLLDVAASAFLNCGGQAG